MVRYIYDPYIEIVYLWKTKNKEYPCTIDFSYGRAVVVNLINKEIDVFCAYSRTVENAMKRKLARKITPRWSKQLYKHSSYVFKLEVDK